MPNSKTGEPLTTVLLTTKQYSLFSVTAKLPSDVHTSNTERHWSKKLTTNLLSCLDPLEPAHFSSYALAASPHLESSAGARNTNLAPVGGASHHSDRMGHM